LDLHSEGFSSGASVCDHILLFSVNPAVDFWRFVEMGTLCLPGRPSKVGSALLTGSVASRHDIGVQVPVTKTLGDILYADKSKIRVSEDEWLKLLRAIAGGDQSALHSLYEQTYRIVFTLIVRILMNQETAEEVTLDVFYDVWRRASTYDPANGSVVGWIMNQARSRAIDRLRFDQRKKRVNTYPHDLRPTTDIVDPQQACLFEEQSRLLRDALQLLTAEEHEAIETAFFSELTYEQTANKLNQPLGTVKTRIRSGLGKLREALGMRVKGTG
jgi:RNA polymerase sigma-70 factor (ECF subfamily)